LFFFTVSPASGALSKPLPLAQECPRRTAGVSTEEAGESVRPAQFKPGFTAGWLEQWEYSRKQQQQKAKAGNRILGYLGKVK